MYSVSEKYKEAMKHPVQRHHLKGTVGDREFTDKNILKGSFSITNQCSGNDNVEIGQVYIGELNATFINVPLQRYAWKGTKITPYFGMELDDGTIEYVPLGVFTIDTAEWTKSGVVVKAYDNMSLLDGTCNKTLTEVTPYDCIKRIEAETGVEFANTKEEIEALPNGTMFISETTTNDVETWRDLLAWVAQTVCCFATADREGEIVLRPYTDEVTDTIDNKHRLSGASFSDFVTRYTGLSVVNMSDNKTKYYGLEPDDGLTMNLGSNPFLQYGIEATKEEMCRAILSGLQKINYVPFKVSAIGNPAYDLGDVLVFSDGLADETKKYCITKVTFKYHGKYEMTGVGQDPALSSARSKTDKNIAGLISNTDENTLVHYQFSNTNAIDVGDGNKETIGQVRFGTGTKGSQVSFIAELLIDITNSVQHEILNTKVKEVTVSDPPEVTELQEEIEAADAAIIDLNSRVTAAETVIAEPDRMMAKISYMLNGIELNYHPIETFAIDGKHIISLNYYLGNVKANTIYTFVIMLEMSGGSAHFDMNTVNALLTGMGLAGTGQWDGTITVHDDFKALSLSSVLRAIKDSAVVKHNNEIKATSLSDAFSINLKPIFGSFKENVSAGIVVKYFILSDSEGEASFNLDYVTINSEDAFILQTEYSVHSKNTEVDEGYLHVLDVFSDYEELLTLEGLVIA